MAHLESQQFRRKLLFAASFLIAVAIATALVLMNPAWLRTSSPPPAKQTRPAPQPVMFAAAVDAAAAPDECIGFHGGGPLLGQAAPIGAPPMIVRWKLSTDNEPAAAPADTALPAAATAPTTAPSTASVNHGPGHFEAAAAIVGGFVYVGDTGGALRCINVNTGAVRWTYRIEDGFDTTPLVIANRVMIGDSGGIFHCVDAVRGTKLWTFDSGSTIHSSANFLGANREHVVFGNDGADIFCLEVETGKKVWEQKAGDRVNGAPAVSNGSALISGCDAQLRGLRAADGQEEFETDLGALCPGSVAVDGNRLILGTDQGRVLCVAADTHKPLWTFEGVAEQAMVYSSPAVADGMVVFGARDRSIYGLELSTGKRLWKTPTRGDVDSSPVISAGRVYIGSKDKKLYVLDLKSGKEIWSFTAGRGIVATPAIAEGVVVIGDSGGHLFCLEPGRK